MQPPQPSTVTAAAPAAVPERQQAQLAAAEPAEPPEDAAAGHLRFEAAVVGSISKVRWVRTAGLSQWGDRQAL